MELTLLLFRLENDETVLDLGFNPCFIGTYSITHIDLLLSIQLRNVLILVLLELTLLPDIEIDDELIDSSFNPCFIGTYSITLF